MNYELIQARLQTVERFCAEARRRRSEGRTYEWGGSPGEYWEGLRDGLAVSLRLLGEEE